MKTNLKLIGMVASLGVLLTTINGCKKTETEQLSHYQSANHRILGTWELKSSSDKTTTVTTSTTTNDVNGTTATSSATTTATITYSGNTYTSTTVFDTSSVDVVVDWNDPVNPIGTTTSTNTVEVASTTTTTWLGSSAVSVWKDNTFNQTQTTYQNQAFSSLKSINSSSVTTTNNTSLNMSYDTTYVNMDKNTSTGEGSWMWLDSDHNNLDLSLYAGLMGGNITSLSSTQVVFEENDKQNDSDTDYWETDLKPFSNTANPSQTSAGIQTTVTTKVVTRKYTETWEKTSSETMP